MAENRGNVAFAKGFVDCGGRGEMGVHVNAPIVMMNVSADILPKHRAHRTDQNVLTFCSLFGSSTVYGRKRWLQLFDGRANRQQLFIGIGATGQLQTNRQASAIEATVQA